MPLMARLFANNHSLIAITGLDPVIRWRAPGGWLHFVIPGRHGAAHPESMNTGFWNIDPGFGPSGRPGMAVGVLILGLIQVPGSSPGTG
jgi:hypothetical protein